jgi:hypothetical protein
MSLSKRIVHIVSVLLVSVSVHIKAQFVDYGADPLHYKWNIVRTEHYNLIYPQGSDSMARRYISLLETAYPRIERTMSKPIRKKFPVVLHPGNMLSNGMVSWAPRRMEMITTPGPDQHAQANDRHLVAHESRHVMQTGKLMNGIFRPFYYLVGEQIQGVAALFAPNWFFEGDAVSTETALSGSGRGRLPEFNMIYRAHRIDGRFYSFDKWNLGSHRHHTGTYYALGYDLTAYARRQFGEDVWDRVIDRYARRIAIPPFGKALRHVTGVTPRQLFNQTFTFLEKEWKAQDAVWQQSGSRPDYLSPAGGHYNAYRYPQALNDSVIIAVRSNYRDLTALVKIAGGKEERLAYLGNINSRIVLNNNRVYWTEYMPGRRWTHLNYSALKSYDLGTGRIATVTPRRRYLGPAIDPDGRLAALSEISDTGENSLALVDPQTGEVHARHSIPGNAFAKELTFAGGDEVIALTVDDAGIRLLKLHIPSGEWSELLAATRANITGINWQDGRLLFESGLDGTNNIYAYDPSTAAVDRLTAARFGAFTPALSADGRRLLYADYQTDGYRLAALGLDTLRREPADFAAPYRFELAETLARQEGFDLDTARIDLAGGFNPRRYRKALHLFKFHSWAPFYYDATNASLLLSDDFSTAVQPGATVISQNSLNTAVAQAGWYYRDGEHHGKFTLNYSGWLPVINLSVDYGGKTVDQVWRQSVSIGGGAPPSLTLMAMQRQRTRVEAEATVYLPLTLTHNHYVRGIQPSVSYLYTNDKFHQHDSKKYNDYQYVYSQVQFYNYRKMAKQDILPRWGYRLYLQHLVSLRNTDNCGAIYAARLTGYLPGLRRGDGLMLRMTYQFQDVDGKYVYLPQQIVPTARGYNYPYATRQLIGMQADYAFSLCYPDLSIGSLLYVQRLRSNLFYDDFRNQYVLEGERLMQKQRTAGIDLIMDCNILQANFPISLGARIMNDVGRSHILFETLFSVTF